MARENEQNSPDGHEDQPARTEVHQADGLAPQTRGGDEYQAPRSAQGASSPGPSRPVAQVPLASYATAGPGSSPQQTPASAIKKRRGKKAGIVTGVVLGTVAVFLMGGAAGFGLGALTANTGVPGAGYSQEMPQGGPGNGQGGPGAGAPGTGGLGGAGSDQGEDGSGQGEDGSGQDDDSSSTDEGQDSTDTSTSAEEVA